MAKFTVGMEVCITPRITGPYEFSTVENISPSGRVITLADGRKFTSDGREYRSRGDWHYETMEPLTDEVRQRIATYQAEQIELARRKKLGYRIGNAIKGLTADQLQQIVDLIATFPGPAKKDEV